ncbi:hypothetical protein PN497_18530 [Sphaerospermopsis kisseleviana CS-549]|uniref:Uncharacterized protein n=1 Tax=Sphaerospermopsis kisseleviana CS-549 TaxID=3021783 RepID=A0ABT4ZV84_9CYAN|nr:hypothetical protein [Sphaerospermopsis kisseleviana]MDB9443339.1 hypothetical protein [Sphaerospermopsis kisseleviana CS-549]BAZ83318.1 hypothetical protein NIES73_46050 [Sphaerospermopsis kisseleviana NIES-73]
MYEEFIDFEGIFNLALQHTEELINMGIDISDPSGVTELEWIANKYPEIAERCNEALLELVEKQTNTIPAFVGAGYSDHDLPSF